MNLVRLACPAKVNIIMNRVVCLFFTVLVSCQGPRKALTVQEANLRADAGLRYGLITKEGREHAIAEVLIKNAPLTATTDKEKARLDPVEIDRRASQLASKYEPYATWSRQYNMGKISPQRLDQLYAQEDFRNQQLLAMRQARGAAISAAITQGIAASSVPTYRPPAFLPLSGFGSGINRYDPNSLSNPYGAGSPYKADGLMNPYSQYGSQYSNDSWTNPYATNAPKIYSQDGSYHGRMSTNKYDQDSISNPYGRFGNKYSPDSLNNPYGAGNPYSSTKYYVVPQR